MNEQFWTDERELERYAEAARASQETLPGAMMEALRGWHASRPLDLTFPKQATIGQLAAWEIEARQWIEKRLAWPPINVPLDPRVHQRFERDGYIEEQIRFVGASPLRLPATVLTPVGTGPFPAVLALHSMGGMRPFGREKLLAFEGEPAYLTAYRRQNYEGASIMLDLVRRGYVVMAIDAQNFGERTLAAMKDFEAFHALRCGWNMQQAREFSMDISFMQEPMLTRNVIAVGRTWAGLIVADDRRSLDYLVSLPQVDASRVGCAGLSFGAYRANYLAALDERIAAAVSVCWTSTMDGVVGYNVSGGVGWFMLVPQLFARMDLTDLQALAAPRPFMAISGWQDTLMQPFGIAQAHQRLRRAWSAWQSPQTLGSLVFDCPHEFNAAMQQQAWRFLDHWLKR